MRLRILSDLHMEFEPFAAPATVADAVILAGDISTGLKGFKWAQATFTDCPVIYVLGNHEFYGQKLQKLIEQLKEMARVPTSKSWRMTFLPSTMSPSSARRFGQILH